VWYEQRLSALVVDRTANLPTRVTALGVIGQRRVRACAPTLRELAASAPEPSIRRGALAALGSCGDASDRVVVQRFLHDGNRLIALAAQGADKRLAALTAIPASSTPQP
jgi:hypothetical protein